MKAHFVDHAFERHSHETYSVGVTLSGVQTFHCRGALHASLRGDVILFNPDEAHDGQRGSHDGFGYAILYVQPDVMNECQDRDAGLDAPRHFAEPVVHDPAMGGVLLQAVEALGQPQETLRAQELTRTALTGLLLRHGERRSARSPRRAADARVDRVRDLLQAQFDSDLTVDVLAREAGLSRVHLTRTFSRQFGVPPHVYLNAVRVHRAQAALRGGMPLAEVAAACGFADQSHFSRRFKGSVGLAPGAWLKQMRA